MDNMDDLENPCDDQQNGIERWDPSPLINLDQQRPQNGHHESEFLALKLLPLVKTKFSSVYILIET